MMHDFKEYKESTNALFSKLTKQYKDEIMVNTARIDHNEIQTQRNRDRMELFDEEFRSFEEKRLEMITHMKDLEEKVIHVE